MHRTLLLSLEEQKNIDMIYLDDNGNLTQRIVKVLEIQEHYIKAFCFLRKGKRTFKLDNILSVSKIRRSRKVGA
ncbi:WYL domain-containing protein [Mesobacillus thioparans]